MPLGQQVTYNSIPAETFRSFGFPGDDNPGNMFQFYRDFDKVCNQVRKMDFSKELHPELKSFDAWLSENAQPVPLEPAAAQ